ncbi:hypothetical protein J4463_03040 [Candidatus Pacearchaeota archaeon]|nr:hypothetical protein [Candidatus Pacearchaeota archaeon]
MNSLSDILGMIATEAAEAIEERAGIRYYKTDRPITPIHFGLEIIEEENGTYTWVE